MSDAFYDNIPCLADDTIASTSDRICGSVRLQAYADGLC